MALAVDSSGSLASFSIKWIREVRLLELNVDHFTNMWVVARDLLKVALCRLAQVPLSRILSALHQAIKLNLLQMVASRSLQRVHARVFDRWEVHIIRDLCCASKKDGDDS